LNAPPRFQESLATLIIFENRFAEQHQGVNSYSPIAGTDTFLAAQGRSDALYYGRRLEGEWWTEALWKEFLSY
jgi:hypothetical protein